MKYTIDENGHCEGDADKTPMDGVIHWLQEKGYDVLNFDMDDDGEFTCDLEIPKND